MLLSHDIINTNISLQIRAKGDVMKRQLRLVLILIGVLFSSQIVLVGAQDDADYCAALRETMARMAQQSQRLLEEMQASEGMTDEELDAFLATTDMFLLLINAEQLLEETFDVFCAPLLAEAEGSAGDGTGAITGEGTNQAVVAETGTTTLSLFDLPIPDDDTSGWTYTSDYVTTYRPYDETYPVFNRGWINFWFHDNGQVFEAGIPYPSFGDPAPTGCEYFATFDGNRLHFRGRGGGIYEVIAQVEITGTNDRGNPTARLSGMFQHWDSRGEYLGSGTFESEGNFYRKDSGYYEGSTPCGSETEQ
jgi:hypothetical protein